jgi:hypothetical protein
VRLAAAGAVALTLTGVGSPATTPRAVEVPWNARVHGGVQFVTDRESVWMVSGTLLGSNVWRIDPRTLRLTRTPLPRRMRELVAGGGQLWALELREATPHLYYVDVRGGYRLREKRLPRGCGLVGHDHRVFRGRLWFRCDFHRFAVFDPRRPDPVRTMTSEEELLEGAGALWLLDLQLVMRCLEGPCNGRFPVGTTGAWDEGGDAAWVVRSGFEPTVGLLELVHFPSRAVLTFELQLPRGLSRPTDLRVVGDELWVQGGTGFVVARYSVNAPTAPPRLLTLPGLSRLAESSFAAETGGGYAWIHVRDGRDHKVYRVDLPRDPLPLRRIRAALARELERTPQRFGVARTAGPPAHVSCSARRMFQGATAFGCHVRYRAASKFFCAAIVGGRLTLDRRLRESACRR